jgi:Xaa-Pro aminopeptidase
MHNLQRQQTHALLKEKQINRAIFANPHSVTWLTGFAPPVQTGPNLFAAGNPLVWYEDGQFTLITVDAYADLAAPFANEPDGGVITYTGYSLNEPIAGGKHLAAEFQKLVGSAPIATIGIEQEFVSTLIGSHFPNAEVVAIDGWLEPMRMIKTPEELEKLRRSFALTDIGHATARQSIMEGAREIDVWNMLHMSIQSAAGRRVPVGNDCVVGSRSPFNVGGWPLDYVIKPQDSLIVDISVILDGYWSDSCATYYAGERTPKQEKLHRIITEALEFGISLVKPGMVAKDIDQQLRQFIIDSGYPAYPHHTGHGVGVSGHEAPRIVPYNDQVLREGMVIMLEPGIYFPGETGVRLEDAVLVTATGAELLTHHDKS